MSDNTPAGIPSLSDIKDSIIRTVTPIIVGWLLSVLLLINVTVTPETRLAITNLIGAVLSALYYIVVRWLEQKYPGLGWLLGKPVQPTYVNAKTISGEIVHEPEVLPAAPPVEKYDVDAIVDEVAGTEG